LIKKSPLEYSELKRNLRDTFYESGIFMLEEIARTFRHLDNCLDPLCFSVEWCD